MNYSFMDFDIYRETKDGYFHLRREEGYSRADAVQEIYADFAEKKISADASQWHILWIGLAEAQCRYKELTEDVSRQALEALQHIEVLGIHLTPGQMKKKQERYVTHIGPEKKLRKRHRHRCIWGIGDVFSCILKGKLAEHYGLAGALALIQKIGEYTSSDGFVCPLITVRLCPDSGQVITEELLNNTQPLRINPLSFFGGSKSEYIYAGYIYFTSKRDQQQLEVRAHGNFPIAPLPADDLKWYSKPTPGVYPWFYRPNFIEQLCHTWAYDCKTRNGEGVSFWEKEGAAFMEFIQTQCPPEIQEVVGSVLERTKDGTEEVDNS